MTRLRSLTLCACLALSLAAMACSSSSSDGGVKGGPGGAAGGSGSSLWDEARIANTGTDWWLNIRKGAITSPSILLRRIRTTPWDART